MYTDIMYFLVFSSLFHFDILIRMWLVIISINSNVPFFIVPGGEDIVTLEKEASKLSEEVAEVEMAREELGAEVEEYVQETKAPLLEITEEIAALDIHRIRKLL